VNVCNVETAAEMEDVMMNLAVFADVIVMAAAVADFRPTTAAHGKIKKDTGIPEIVLEPTPDILAALGAGKLPDQTLVGFAAETDDVLANAQAKLRRKNLDLIVANDVSAPGVGFRHDTNAVTLIRADGSVSAVPLSDKRAVARAVLDSVCEIRNGAGHAGKS
jgi:phosphopantothenoylcysteine decarboxylase/phosphopantothenate--cysteine ligase